MTHDRLFQWVLNKFCKITPEWLLNDSCMTNEYLLNEFWRSSERALRDTWMTPEWLVDEFCISSEEFWMSSEWLLNAFWISSEGVQNEFSMSSERVLNDFWIKSEWVGNGTLTAAEWLPMTPEWLLHKFRISSAWSLLEFQKEFRLSCEWAETERHWTWMRQSLQEFSMVPETSVRVTCWDNPFFCSFLDLN